MTNFSGQREIKSYATRRAFLKCAAATTAAAAVGAVLASARQPAFNSELAFGIVDQVVPATGIRTETVFGDAIQKLITAGVLDRRKYRAVYSAEGRVPAWVERSLMGNSFDPIILSAETAPYLLNLLWPLGLANKTKFNSASPLNTPNIPNFASMAGWTLGREPNGAAYFNSVNAAPLTNDQDALTFVIASNSFRPCCDNSTLFQDCNHGSALLGLLELAASQGATERDLYWMARAANSYWFPDYYIRTAIYFAQTESRRWDEVDPKRIMGKRFSSLTGWMQNVFEPQARAGIKPPAELLESASC